MVEIYLLTGKFHNFFVNLDGHQSYKNKKVYNKFNVIKNPLSLLCGQDSPNKLGWHYIESQNIQFSKCVTN